MMQTKCCVQGYLNKACLFTLSIFRWLTLTVHLQTKFKHIFILWLLDENQKHWRELFQSLDGEKLFLVTSNLVVTDLFSTLLAQIVYGKTCLNYCNQLTKWTNFVFHYQYIYFDSVVDFLQVQWTNKETK